MITAGGALVFVFFSTKTLQKHKGPDRDRCTPKVVIFSPLVTTPHASITIENLLVERDFHGFIHSNFFLIFFQIASYGIGAKIVKAIWLQCTFCKNTTYKKVCTVLFVSLTNFSCFS